MHIQLGIVHELRKDIEIVAIMSQFADCLRFGDAARFEHRG